MTNLLAGFGLDVVGIDVSPVCIELARNEKPKLDLRVMEAGELKFEDSSLDGLVAY